MKKIIAIFMILVLCGCGKAGEIDKNGLKCLVPMVRPDGGLYSYYDEENKVIIYLTPWGVSAVKTQ